MNSTLARYISRKVFRESLSNNFGHEVAGHLIHPKTSLFTTLQDPYFTTVPATHLNGEHLSRNDKKRHKALPAGISEHDAKILTKVKRRAYHLDIGLFNCCGIRLGWSSIIAIIPGYVIIIMIPRGVSTNLPMVLETQSMHLWL
jgi:hypothetical protein